ncbi:MAG TPA: NAD(P)-binding domain-containing protein [Pyrinomonadaceae bacterium]|nr:NAD(P)-binding domain-containing protein [Pyrinomonadaceae bacterium]
MIRKVGFIGLGTMEKPMAINIAQAGFDLIVYDIREARLHDLKLDRGDEYAQRDR